jgi:hypothetical protein
MPNDLPKYDNLPPLSPAHKPKIALNSKDALPLIRIKIEPKPLNDHELSGWKELIKNHKPIDIKRLSCCEYLGLSADKIDALSPHKPTPTIPQMSDLHERQVFADNAERLINKVLNGFLKVLAVLFVGGMIYRTFVWGH